MPSNLEILSYEMTSLGLLCLRRRELLSAPGTIVTEVTLNHEFLMSSLYTESERSLARLALEMHTGTDLNVLVGGLGLGYTACETLQSDRVAHVVVTELLPQVIDWFDQELVPLSSEINQASRLDIAPGDVYQQLAAPPQELWDVILIDVDHSPQDRLDDQNAVFYTEQGLHATKRHLSPGGVLGVWSYAECSPFADALHRVFHDVRVEPVSHHNHLVDEFCTDWLFFARR